MEGEGDKPIIQLDADDAKALLDDVDNSQEEAQDTSKETDEKTEENEEKPKSKKASKKADDDKSMADETEEEDVLGSAKAEDEQDESDKTDEDESTEETAEQQAEKQRNADTRKQQLQTEIRDLVSQKKQLTTDVETLSRQAYRTQTTEELQEQGLSEAEAENESLRQELEFNKYISQVSDLSSQVGIESMQLMADFPQFDPKSPLFDEPLWKRVTELYEDIAEVRRDPKTNLVTQVRVFPYNFYKAFAETQSSSAETNRAQGQVEGQKAAEKNLAAAETPSSTAPKTPRKDPFVEGLLGKYKRQ